MTPPRTTHRLYGGTKIEIGEARKWIGSRVIDASGSNLGRLEDVWVDETTGEPEWLLIREGRFTRGSKKLAPFAGATGGGGQVWLPQRRELVRSSPEIRAEEMLTAGVGKRLRRHYRLDTPQR